MYEFIKGSPDNLVGKVLAFSSNEYGDPFCFKGRYFFPSLGANVKRISGIQVEIETFTRDLSADFPDEAKDYSGDVLRGPNIVSRPNGKSKEGIVLAQRTLGSIIGLYVLSYVNQQLLKTNNSLGKKSLRQRNYVVEDVYLASLNDTSLKLKEAVLKGRDPIKKLKDLEFLTADKVDLKPNVAEISDLINRLTSTKNKEILAQAILLSIDKLRFTINGRYESAAQARDKIKKLIEALA